jgi:hypothetical protein
MRLRCSFTVVYIVYTVSIVLLAGCDSSSSPPPGQAPADAGTAVSRLNFSGQGRFPDGTPVATRNIQIQTLLDGANLFQAGVDGCSPTPAHVAGTAIESVGTDAQGQYALSLPIGELRAAVVRDCALQTLHTAQVEGLTVRASILADAESCAAYCAAQAAPAAGCVTDCATGNRTLVATQALGSAEFAAKVSATSLQWTPPLVFTSLGPSLTPEPGPDLVVDALAARQSAHVTQESFAADSCEIAESCVRAPGARRLLRFDGSIENLGSSDLVIGSPEESPLFYNSSCHNVPLLKDIMLYELLDPATGQVMSVDGQQVVGRKQGFCMMDIVPLNASSAQGQYDCSNQGITAGWADVYDSALDCQYLDVTGVPAGAYTLRLTVNPGGLFGESDMTNNTAQIPVTIPAP